jgi:hypothetical protein
MRHGEPLPGGRHLVREWPWAEAALTAFPAPERRTRPSKISCRLLLFWSDETGSRCFVAAGTDTTMPWKNQADQLLYLTYLRSYFAIYFMYLDFFLSRSDVFF